MIGIRPALRLTLTVLGTVVAVVAPHHTSAQVAAAAEARGSRAAATVYRCEPPAGSASRAVYGDQPCPQGTAIDANDGRSERERREARQRTREEAQWAEGMRKDRLRQERLEAAQAQRAAPVIDQPRVDIAPDPRRDAELKRLSRAPRRAAPPPANAGNAPTAKPGRP